MSKINVPSVELQNCQQHLPQWADVPNTPIGQVSPLEGEQELRHYILTSRRSSSGRIDFTAFDNAVLSKFGTTPHIHSSIRIAAPAAAVLVAQLSGSCRLEQYNRSCTLYPGDWSLVNALDRHDAWSLEEHNEYLVLTLELPSDPEWLDLLERGAGRRFGSKVGLSRILLVTLTECFNQVNQLGASGRRRSQFALTQLTWGAVGEQLEAPLTGLYRHVLCARVKSYIEQHLADLELSVDSIAQGCGMSVRSIHRAFQSESADSVSHYLWMRRLNRCAASLRDPEQVHRSITDICFAWGFNSTSHFSRLFKEQFGVPPREYRMTSTRRETADLQQVREKHAA